MAEHKINIYLADDHKIIIEGLELLISNEPSLRVVGTATDGITAHREILSKNPDIALIDYRMPGMNGIDLINSLRKQVQTKFVILSMHSENRYIRDAMSYGAYGYLLKNTGKEELMRCIEKVIKGETYFPVQAANKSKNKDATFTPRELEILRLVANGFTTQQIADDLNLSHFTVETHRKNISKKTGTKNALGLLKYINENNIDISAPGL